jgi:hypothetical protein
VLAADIGATARRSSAPSPSLERGGVAWASWAPVRREISRGAQPLHRSAHGAAGRAARAGGELDARTDLLVVLRRGLDDRKLAAEPAGSGIV